MSTQKRRSELAEAKEIDSSINEKLADSIQNELKFKIGRLPSHVFTRFDIVQVILIFLQVLLITSNNIKNLGLWQSFTRTSSGYRDEFNSAILRKTGFLDFTKIDSLSLWRGWVIPSVLASFAYVLPALICLRHELYHWKPELLEYYFARVRDSHIGGRIPRSWLNAMFQHYEYQYREYEKNKTQPHRQHTALQDSTQFFKIVRVVALNIGIGVLCVLVLWLALLQTNIDTLNFNKLPRSYVPAVQMIAWYVINDLFYFYPHWISHTTPTISSPLYARVIPRQLATLLHQHFKASHRLHHRTKANIGIAAWYCSPTEQILFNMFPALLGPLLTQLLADATGMSMVWGTHFVTLYVWLMAAASSSVLAHSGYRSVWNDPGKHDLHHERAFDPKDAVNFGTLGFFDWLHGTSSSLPAEETRAWKAQRDRQAALHEASKRSGVPLTQDQRHVIQQPSHSIEWEGDKEKQG